MASLLSASQWRSAPETKMPAEAAGTMFEFQ